MHAQDCPLTGAILVYIGNLDGVAEAPLGLVKDAAERAERLLELIALGGRAVELEAR